VAVARTGLKHGHRERRFTLPRYSFGGRAVQRGEHRVRAACTHAAQRAHVLLERSKLRGASLARPGMAGAQRRVCTVADARLRTDASPCAPGRQCVRWIAGLGRAAGSGCFLRTNSTERLYRTTRASSAGFVLPLRPAHNSGGMTHCGSERFPVPPAEVVCRRHVAGGHTYQRAAKRRPLCTDGGHTSIGCTTSTSQVQGVSQWRSPTTRRSVHVSC
jgi:hypothetical protein